MVEPQRLTDQTGAATDIEHRPVVRSRRGEKGPCYPEVVLVGVLLDEPRFVAVGPPGVQVSVVVRSLDRVGISQVEIAVTHLLHLPLELIIEPMHSPQERG